MKHLALVVFGAGLAACGPAWVRINAVPPPPPEATVTVEANAAAPAPPAEATPAEAPSAPEAPAAEANVEVAPEVTTADPEEVTATTEPPDPVYEEPTDTPGPGYYWVHGYWGWTGSDWAWYSGRWLVAPEGRVYIEPYYERVGPNVVYVNGYWGVRGAAYRSYGGERIRFAEAVRPADYRRGERARFERRAGSAPGARGNAHYERASGPARPIPHATAPAYRTAARGPSEIHNEGARGAAGHEGMGHEPGQMGQQREGAGHEAGQMGQHEGAGHGASPTPHAAGPGGPQPYANPKPNEAPRPAAAPPAARPAPVQRAAPPPRAPPPPPKKKK